MKAYRVICIGKAAPGAPAEITHIGNATDRWIMACATVIQHVELGMSAFYVLDEQTGQRSAIGFAREEGRRPYLFSHVAGQCNAQLDALEVLATERLRPA